MLAWLRNNVADVSVSVVCVCVCVSYRRLHIHEGVREDDVKHRVRSAAFLVHVRRRDCARLVSLWHQGLDVLSETDAANKHVHFLLIPLRQPSYCRQHSVTKDMRWSPARFSNKTLPYSWSRPGGRGRRHKAPGLCALSLWVLDYYCGGRVHHIIGTGLEIWNIREWWS